jgi:hypothetical protein
MNSTAVNANSSLEVLARAIRIDLDTIDDHERSAADATRNALRVALDAGTKLIWAKSKDPPGGGMEWVKKNCDLPARTEQLYRHLAEHRGDIERALKLNPKFSIRAAVKLIAKPKPRPQKHSTDPAAIRPGPAKVVDPAGVRLDARIDRLAALLRECLASLTNVTPNNIESVRRKLGEALSCVSNGPKPATVAIANITSPAAPTNTLRHALGLTESEVEPIPSARPTVH